MKELIYINNKRPTNQNKRPVRDYNYRPARNNYNYPPANINSYNQVRRTAPYRQFGKRPKNYIKYVSRFLLFLVFTVIIFAVFAGLFFLNLTKKTPPPDFIYAIETVIYAGGGETSKTINITMPHETGFANNVHYFPINQIMDFLDFNLAGDTSEPSFIRKSPNEDIKLEIGSNIVYINGAKNHLTAPSFIADNNIYVPLDFILTSFNNIKLKDVNILAAERNDDQPELYFKINAIAALSPIDESTPENALFLALHGSDSVNFRADLSAYEQYFNPPQEQANEYIKLINQTNHLDAEYFPPDLTVLIDTRGDREPNQARLYAAKAAEAMLIEARMHGHTNISITSGYRSYATQISIFNHNVAQLMNNGASLEEATAQTALAIAYPGQSEHQSGLAIDMHSNTAATRTFGSQPDGIWLAENAHHFGFIVRYPDGKTHITGIQYEPWHFRYVGRFHAIQIYQRGLTLEEYHEQVLR